MGKKIEIDRRLLIEMMRYIRSSEVLINDDRAREYKTLAQLLKDHAMPELYYQILESLKK